MARPQGGEFIVLNPDWANKRSHKYWANGAQEDRFLRPIFDKGDRFLRPIFVKEDRF